MENEWEEREGGGLGGADHAHLRRPLEGRPPLLHLLASDDLYVPYSHAAFISTHNSHVSSDGVFLVRQRSI